MPVSHQKKLRIGILALQGDVIEHSRATKNAVANLSMNADVVEVRTKQDLENLDALIIPGGESTVLYKLCEREGIIEAMKKIKNIFGTCAGAIMLAKDVKNKTTDQKTLELMDIYISRNAYGRQTDSFERDVNSNIAAIKGIFIRAPQIKKVSKGVKVLAKCGSEIVACEQKIASRYYLASCFHPEITTSKFHEYFIKQATN